MSKEKSDGKTWLAAGAILAGVAVGLGAFGTHGLQSLIENKVGDPVKNLGYWETANRYQLLHSLAVMMVGLASGMFGGRFAFKAAGTLMVVGIILFSGSLYVLAVTDLKMLGAVTPVGGMAWIIGWLVLAVSFYKERGES
jgi:uncharacterized membrane protein YgdD (TMEM256/DUF423 family)